jgi:hypothetical protein
MLILNQILIFFACFFNFLTNFEILFSVCFEQIHSQHKLRKFSQKMVKEALKKPLEINKLLVYLEGVSTQRTQATHIGR